MSFTYTRSPCVLCSAGRIKGSGVGTGGKESEIVTEGRSSGRKKAVSTNCAPERNHYSKSY